MILVKMMGGLGNQMFQYAAGRRLALSQNQELHLDLSWYSKIPDGDTPRTFQLQHYNIEAQVASEQDIADVLRRCGHKRLFSCLLKGDRSAQMIEEVNLSSDASIRARSRDVYMKGWWADERYFRDIKDTLRCEFSLRQPPMRETVEIAKQIDERLSVSIHVRRGDYVTNSAANSFHGLCSLDYYRNAVRYMQESTGHASHFYIFSDDKEWISKNFDFIENRTIVSHNSISHPHEDIYLMRLCRHNIIANSSFSWWGAWLNANPEKIVMAPKSWYRNTDKNSEHLLPKEWVQL